MNIEKYKLDDEDAQFVRDIELAFRLGAEIDFYYKDEDHRLDCSGQKAVAYNISSAERFMFESAEDFLLHYIIDGNPLIVRIGDIDGYDM